MSKKLKWLLLPLICIGLYLVPVALEIAQVAHSVSIGGGITAVYTQAATASPTYVQSVAMESTMGPSAGEMNPTPGTYYFPLPNPTGTGANCVFVPFYTGSGSDISSTLSMTDDASPANTYTIVAKVVDTYNDNSAYLFAGPQTHSARKITLTNTTGSTYTEPHAVEVANLNTSSCTSPEQTWTNDVGTATGTATAGSATKTTGHAGDWLLMFAGRTATFTATSYTPGSQSNITWNLITAVLEGGMVTQGGVYAVTTAINPTLTWAPNDDYMAFAVAVQKGSGGTLPSGLRIVNIYHVYDPGTGTSETYQVPTTGNAIALRVGGSNADYVSTITDSTSDTWHQAFLETKSAASGDIAIWYTCSTSPSSTRTVTVTYAATPTTGETRLFYDLIGTTTGSSTSCYDKSWTNNGSASSSGNVTMVTSIAPTNANELLIAGASQASGFITGVLSPFPYFDFGDVLSTTGSDQCGGGYTAPNPIDNCDGAAHYLDPNTSSISLGWSTSIAMGDWAAGVAAFH